MKISFIVYVWRGSMNGYDACRTGSCKPLRDKHMLIYPRDENGGVVS